MTEHKHWRAKLLEKKDAAYTTYRREQNRCEDMERNIDGWLTSLKRDGIVLVDHDEARTAKHMITDFDIYDEMEAWCLKVRRPYIKCLRANWNRIVLSTDIKNRGLVANLLFVANPVTQTTDWSGKAKKFTLQKVDFIAGSGYNRKSSSTISSWITTTTITLCFHGDEGEEQFKDWQKYMTTDRMQRMYLGLA